MTDSNVVIPDKDRVTSIRPVSVSPYYDGNNVLIGFEFLCEDGSAYGVYLDKGMLSKMSAKINGEGSEEIAELLAQFKQQRLN